MHSCFHLESAIVPPLRPCCCHLRRRCQVAIAVVNPSFGEALGRTTKCDDNNYNNDRPLLSSSIPWRRKDGIVVIPPMQSSRHIPVVHLQVRLPSSCHKPADLALAYAVES